MPVEPTQAVSRRRLVRLGGGGEWNAECQLITRDAGHEEPVRPEKAEGIERESIPQLVDVDALFHVPGWRRRQSRRKPVLALRALRPKPQRVNDVHSVVQRPSPGVETGRGEQAIADRVRHYV